MKNQVQLITYPDSLGGNLKALNEVLMKHFSGVFNAGVHVLPPFPSSGDRGFAPLTYSEIDTKFGTWEDIEYIGSNFNLMVDLMVNHISRESVYFRDFLKQGRSSKYADLFITLDKLWDNGVPLHEDIDKMFLRRPLPYSTYIIEQTGYEETVWTTFGKTDPSEQVDLDIRSQSVRQLLSDTLAIFKQHNVQIVRLDAVGYIIKKLGTSCFFVEPDIYDFFDWISELAYSMGIELLPEVHAHSTIQYRLAERGHWIYDFILPYTILYTLINKSSAALNHYLKTRPHKQVTMLDCHDGIPVKPDLDDLIDTREARNLVDICLERGANLSRILSDKFSNDGFDVHQIRCTYYSALDCDDDAYLAARAIQFFAPGVPQVYYVGLLAGENDYVNARRTGDGRDINRHNFSIREIEESLERPVVQRLIRLMNFRNEYDAFNGKFQVMDASDESIHLTWESGEQRCSLFVELSINKSVIEYIDNDGEVVQYFI